MPVGDARLLTSTEHRSREWLLVSVVSPVWTDGNHITRSTSALIARDAEDRTPREHNGVVYLQDPIAGIAYVIDTQSKSVKSYPIRLTEPSDNAAEAVTLGNQFVNPTFAVQCHFRRF